MPEDTYLDVASDALIRAVLEGEVTMAEALRALRAAVYRAAFWKAGGSPVAAGRLLGVSHQAVGKAWLALGLGRRE